jgi:hypothetical protein
MVRGDVLNFAKVAFLLTLLFVVAVIGLGRALIQIGYEALRTYSHGRRCAAEGLDRM